jgi:hypothetical protein
MLGCRGCFDFGVVDPLFVILAYSPIYVSF